MKRFREPVSSTSPDDSLSIPGKRHCNGTERKGSHVGKEEEEEDQEATLQEKERVKFQTVASLMEGVWSLDQEEVEEMQEDVGIRQMLDTSGPFLILSEGWPSWLLALRGVGATDMSFWIQCGRPSLSLALQHLGLGKHYCWTWGSAMSKITNNTKVLIQGSQQFVLNKMDVVINTGLPLCNIIAVQDVSVQGVDDDPCYSKNTIVLHQQVGGVTSG